MAEHSTDRERRENARKGRLHRRAERRARQRRARAGHSAPLRLRLGWTLLELFWAIQEKVAWPLADRARAAADAASWPFEQAAWTIRRRLTWPLRDRLAATTSGRALPGGAKVAAGTLCALAIGAATAGALVAQPGKTQAPALPAEPIQVAQVPGSTPAMTPQIVESRTEPKPDGPLLKGVRPNFNAKPKSESDRAVVARALRELRTRRKAEEATESCCDDAASAAAAAADAAEAGEEGGAAGDDQVPGGGSDQPASASGATTDKQGKGRGDEPLKVAERFATAFVKYEIGKADGQTEEVFRQTARKKLARSLAERPPRQPAGERVPKARVFNVVAGPRKKRKLTVSVGLLRLSGVSELRLDLERTSAGWLVSTVRG